MAKPTKSKTSKVKIGNKTGNKVKRRQNETTRGGKKGAGSGGKRAQSPGKGGQGGVDYRRVKPGQQPSQKTLQKKPQGKPGKHQPAAAKQNSDDDDDDEALDEGYLEGLDVDHLQSRSFVSADLANMKTLNKHRKDTQKERKVSHDEDASEENDSEADDSDAMDEDSEVSSSDNDAEAFLRGGETKRQDVISSYENRPRRFQTEAEAKPRLPTKLPDGRVVQQRQQQQQQPVQAEEPSSEDEGQSQGDDDGDAMDEDAANSDEQEDNAGGDDDEKISDAVESDSEEDVYDSAEEMSGELQEAAGSDGQLSDGDSSHEKAGGSKKRALPRSANGDAAHAHKKVKTQDGAGASLSTEELVQRQKQRIQRLKLDIAEMAETILENPERNIGKLNTLHELLSDEDTSIQHIVLVSETEIFKDIIPGYRIRLPTEDELRLQVSKDVKALRKFEAAIIHGYKRLLNYLIDTARVIYRHKGKKAQQFHPKTGVVVVKCLCRLLSRAFHFNYRKELIAAVVPLLNDSSAEIRQLVLKTVTELFVSDVAGDAALEAVQIIGHIVKNRAARVQPELLLSFLHLPLHQDILTADSKSDKERINKSKRKVGKDFDIELEKDLAESKAEVSLAHRKKVYTAILSEVFTCYFRILKQQAQSKSLPVVLKGLAKFAHLINLDLILTLLEYLKTLIATALPFESALNCIIAAFETLRGQGSAIIIDLKEFYIRLFARLWSAAEPENYQHIPLLLQCLHLMFQQSRQLSTDRVASFVKRLLSISLSVPPHASIGILHAVRSLLKTYPRTKQLLDNESTTPGVYLPLLDDPDHTNAFAATSWDPELLSNSSHPYLGGFVQTVIKDTDLPAAVARAAPSKLFALYDSSQGAFNPPLSVPKLQSKKKERQHKAMRKTLGNVVTPFLQEMMDAVQHSQLLELMTFENTHFACQWVALPATECCFAAYTPAAMTERKIELHNSMRNASSGGGVAAMKMDTTLTDAEFQQRLLADRRAFYDEYFPPVVLYKTLSLRAFSNPLYLTRNLSFIREQRAVDKPLPISAGSGGKRCLIGADDLLPLKLHPSPHKRPYDKHMQKRLTLNLQGIILQSFPRVFKGTPEMIVFGKLVRNNLTVVSNSITIPVNLTENPGSIVAPRELFSFPLNFFEYQHKHIKEDTDVWCIHLSLVPKGSSKETRSSLRAPNDDAGPIVTMKLKLAHHKFAPDGVYALELADTAKSEWKGVVQLGIAWRYDAVPGGLSNGHAAHPRGSAALSSTAVANGSAAGSSRHPESGSTPRVVYKFHYVTNSVHQREIRHDWKCPWCPMSCGSLDGVLMHVGSSHDHFVFIYEVGEDGATPEINFAVRTSSKRSIPHICGILTNRILGSSAGNGTAAAAGSAASSAHNNEPPDPESDEKDAQLQIPHYDEMPFLYLRKRGRATPFPGLTKHRKRLRRAENGAGGSGTHASGASGSGEAGSSGIRGMSGDSSKQTKKKKRKGDAAKTDLSDASMVKSLSKQLFNPKKVDAVKKKAKLDKKADDISTIMDREFYHAVTLQRIQPDDFLDEDSDHNVDDTWVTEQADKLVDEFDDVTWSEKQFIKIWNAYSRQNRTYADYLFPQTCRNFAREKGALIRASNLRTSFLLHLLAMWEWDLVTPNDIQECMLIVDQLPVPESVTNRTRAASSTARANAGAAQSPHGHLAPPSSLSAPGVGLSTALPMPMPSFPNAGALPFAKPTDTLSAPSKARSSGGRSNHGGAGRGAASSSGAPADVSSSQIVDEEMDP